MQPYTLGNIAYEITNYLGNVNAVISDRKTWVSTVSAFKAVVLSKTDYFPFACPPRRMFNDTWFSGTESLSGINPEWSFSGTSGEQDNETKGEGNSYTTEFRQYDPRLGRWLSMDPIQFEMPSYSSYAYCFNSPNYFTDKDGDKPDPIFKSGTAIFEWLKLNYPVQLQSIVDADNIRLRHLYAYAISNGKYFEYQVKGAIGEAHFYEKISNESEATKKKFNSEGILPYPVKINSNLGSNIDGFQVDLTLEIQVTAIAIQTPVGRIDQHSQYNLKHTDLSGNIIYSMLEENSTKPGKNGSTDVVRIGFEIKTNNPYGNVDWLFKAFQKGMQQVKDRVETDGLDAMVLVFGYDAMQKLMNSEYKNQVEQMYKDMTNYQTQKSSADSRQVLFLRLVKGQHEDSKNKLNRISKQIRQKFPTTSSAGSECE